jgi:uncharacterized protein (DUF433 family)
MQQLSESPSIQNAIAYTMHVMYNTAITVQRGGTMIERIAVNPRVHFGKPCVAGTRITVQSVLELLDEGLSFEEIIEDYYPDLAIQDIQACIQYAIALVAAEEIHLTAVPA